MLVYGWYDKKKQSGNGSKGTVVQIVGVIDKLIEDKSLTLTQHQKCF